MTDPFDDLHEPVTAVTPDRDFARRLRARLERALALPKGVVPVTAVAEPAAGPRPAAVPYLAVADARAAIAWYVEVFGARVSGEPIAMPDGRIGHAELELAGGALYLSDEHPEIGVTAPRANEHPVSLMLPVSDADVVRGRAIDCGADGSRPPYDGYGERHAWITDPFGHRWGLHSPLRSALPIAYRHGDVVYVSLWVADAERALAFYADALGWQFDDRGPVGTTPAVGIHRSPTDERTLFCCYAVRDLAAALTQVTALGGLAGDAHQEPYGVVANCRDSEGRSFALLDVPESDGPPPPANGNGPGDLTYLTHVTADPARARSFYGELLGWTFAPGRIEDGWNIAGTAPMAGLAGGHERPGAVPQWAVRDIEVAIERVRADGGTSSDAQTQPYGRSATCTDDQGLPFYLLEV